MIGTDPELFFTEDGQVYPAKMAFIGAGIEPPLMSMFGKLIVDGAAIELNPQPGTPEDLVLNMQDLLNTAVTEIESKIPQRLDIKSVLPIDLGWAQKDASLAEFGCDPDRSIWGRESRPDTINAATHPYRYAGFHVHVSDVGDWGDEHIMGLDYTLGLAGMVIAGGRDSARREVYGKPGVYRNQPWGLEYRTPSSELMTSPVYSEFAFQLAEMVTSNINMVNMFLELVPKEVLFSTLRSTDPHKAEEMYNIISTAVGLPGLPEVQPDNWRENWGVE